MKKHLLTGIAIFAAAMVVIACTQHKNPLNKMSSENLTQFLVNASSAAEKNQKIFDQYNGDYYKICMTGKGVLSMCEKLFTDMANYANIKKGYKNVTANDVSDQALYKRIKSHYEEIRFDTP